MATAYKVLAQAAPAATTETTLYTTPALTSTIVSTIAISNQAGTSGTYRIAVRPAADASTTQKHFIVYGATVGASDSILLTLGITLAAGDLIRVYASSADMAFSAFGSELS
jgi:hypothetical protein